MLLDELGLDTQLVAALKLLYVDLKANIKLQTRNSMELIEILIGLKQGCPCSP